MGSGRFPKEGYGKAAYFRDIQLMRNTAFGFDTLSTEEVSTFPATPIATELEKKLTYQALVLHIILLWRTWGKLQPLTFHFKAQ
ncbi:hypothetical protein CK203_116266 [Vitis vinifera]|uniref:Neprosin PEP catalytic domain-containing protein n=1 Tax=Vitis vinifera TaxID=29760 RepID=A0A438E2T3_VITVI|nr:hypothetical protein CK203_116266 [Vitis vinifera]